MCTHTNTNTHIQIYVNTKIGSFLLVWMIFFYVLYVPVCVLPLFKLIGTRQTPVNCVDMAINYWTWYTCTHKDSFAHRQRHKHINAHTHTIIHKNTPTPSSSNISQPLTHTHTHTQTYIHSLQHHSPASSSVMPFDASNCLSLWDKVFVNPLFNFKRLSE